MARAETVTKLPLDSWARIIGLNPMHFNGLYAPSHPPTVCEQPWLQYAWQDSDRVSREEIAETIALAEETIEQHLGYRLLPSWEIEEWVELTRPWRPELVNVTMTDIRGRRPTLQADWGYFVSGGIRASELVEAGVTVTPSDPDGDSFDELATVSLTVAAGQAPCELHVYLPVTGHPGDPRFEIRPVEVEVSGTTATITFARILAVKPELFEDIVPPADDSHHRGVSADEATNFYDEVDVYRVYNDPSQQATLLWEGSGCTCGTSDCQTCAFSAETACLLARGDPRQSVLAYSPATWDADTEQFTTTSICRATSPDAARIWYLAGWEDKSLACPRLQMDPHWARVVSYYAAALLDRPICECNNTRAFVEHWQRDMALAPTEQQGVGQISPNDLDGPLGTTRGALYAWRQIKAAGPVATPVLAPAGGA